MEAAFAQRLRDLRLAAGLTQMALARRAGISRAYLAALERGWSSATKAPPNPSRQLLGAIAQVLGLSVAELTGSQPSLPLPFQAPSPVPGLELLGGAPGPQPFKSSPWELPEADGIFRVHAGVDEALGLSSGDEVLIRRLGPDDVADGLCLLETRDSWSWGRIALIAKAPYVSAPDGSFRPMPEGTRAIAVAIALVRPLNP